MMRELKDKLDLALIAGSNIVAWTTEIEAVLKVALLVISIGYAVDRWIHWRKHKDEPKEKDES
jgi:hypothetical protein